MAQSTIDLKSEERRRQLTLGVLGGLLFATTLPVVNQRALFSPLGDVPLLGDLTPVAYAATFGSYPGPFAGSFRPGNEPGRVGEIPATAFGLRIPGEPAPVTPRGPNGSVPGLPGPIVPGSPLPSSSPFNSGQTGFPGGVGSPGGAFGSNGPGGGGVPGSPGGGTGVGSTPGATGAVPEPSTWLTMILGFAVIGTIMRRSRRRTLASSAAQQAATAQ
jgi:hypothetical protein